MEYANQNHRVNGRAITKVASVYDVLSIPNRNNAPILKIASFTPEDNDLLRAQIQKESSVIEQSVGKEASIDKVAFLTGGLDLFANVKGMLRNKLGMPDETAHELVSPIINQTLKIQQQYGGDEKKIADRLITEMQGQMTDTAPTGENVMGQVQDHMGVIHTKSLEEHVKQRLVDEAGLNNYEADRLKKTIVGEARDLATAIRPYKMDVISNVIIDMVIQKGDPSVVYGLKDSPVQVQQIRAMLEQSAQ